MSLDQNLYTLNFSQREDDRNVVDLIDSNGVLQYTKRRIPGNEYKIEMYDPLSEGLLATVSAPAATSKHKTLQLYNPDLVVELKYTGTITFKWGFKWEDNDFEWRREECYILRKPDPAVLVAVTKEPPGRLQTRTVQLLDYNLNRFDISDRKGLEIVVLTALLTFQDSNEVYHTPREGSTPAATPTPAPTPASEPPTVPPRPEPRQGVERVAEMHAIRTAHGDGEANEIEVWEECSIEDYAHYAERLLNDEAMLFITIRSSSADQVPKVLRVVEETKRLRHKSGVAEEEELYQYVIYDTDKTTPRKGPKRINLNDPDPKKGKDKGKYAPPTSLTVHLSKIDMPELRPKSTLTGSRRPSETGSGRAASSERSPPPVPAPEISDKERRRIEKERQKAEREREREAKKNKKTKGKESASPPPPSGTPPPHRLAKPSSSSPFSSYHTPSFQTHPYQPSPSPSQLNNPMVYTAPPPPPPRHPRPVSMAFPMPDGTGRPQSFYGSGPMGYNAFPEPMDGQAPVGSGYQPGYVSSPQETSSSYPPSGGKGPVSALLEMWSKH
ncbi:hypothetical protein L226DRAFT_471178 [Lentinus tigrinus ALCF2SS1-7]|uniref:Uncharacterized protein n=1 Tax=Lentinus tigrinus ALCF2SS1-6 TaxID=1328759 RepID=A0A5C2S5C2_9APHY|nr:hypothetical protein L227DRAFT_654587 [Lentinus tigrinus ALCF2SS1-6]RPD69849.1 hypothetical protein L226DRAFT_471178 [Lentinus tigrinus ALCF2SS1-7]